jgi:LPS-assembly lipoprotein
VALKNFAARSPMADELRRALSQVAQVVEPGPQAEVQVEALTDAREKSVVATTADGQVREVQLRVRLRFRVVNALERELLPPDELHLSRDMSYNETNALAKEAEELEIYRAMQTDIVDQVMRRLAAARP